MSQIRFGAERLIDAPAAVVYHCIADYREHHRPGGFLPPAFTDLQVERGGVGAGTVIRFTMALGGRRRTVTAQVTEPQPGRVLVETEANGGIQTTFTVEPHGQEGRQARVRFDTVMEAGGLEGLLTRLLAPRLLGPVYADELTRLERLAQTHPALTE
ncbi:MAG TPA: SRPBCC family protein [Chloroflexota bacterium]|nr:SRPBCC family protein [Chloroflexota bacterium]